MNSFILLISPPKNYPQEIEKFMTRSEFIRDYEATNAFLSLPIIPCLPIVICLYLLSCCLGNDKVEESKNFYCVLLRNNKINFSYKKICSKEPFFPKIHPHKLPMRQFRIWTFLILISKFISKEIYFIQMFSMFLCEMSKIISLNSL